MFFMSVYVFYADSSYPMSPLLNMVVFKMDVKTATKIELALRELRTHKQVLIESAGEDLGWPHLDDAIKHLEET